LNLDFEWIFIFDDFLDSFIHSFIYVLRMLALFQFLSILGKWKYIKEEGRACNQARPYRGAGGAAAPGPWNQGGPSRHGICSTEELVGGAP
jgi:hypothetical protein